MVNPKTAVGSNNFVVDFGGNEVPQFFDVNLPSASIPVLEHEVGSKQPYPLKHADQADYGGTFTCQLFAQGSKSAVDKWWDRLKQYKENQNQQSISVTLKDPNGKSVLRWEFADATLVRYEYDAQMDSGEAMKISIEVSYQRMDRKVP